LIFIFRGIECIIFSILFPNCSFLVQILLDPCHFIPFLFLESIAGWNNTWWCLDLVQLVLKELERENM